MRKFFYIILVPGINSSTFSYDTYHDSARRGESVGALVASVNDTFTRYFSTVDFHKDRTEMSNQIGVSIDIAVPIATSHKSE